MNNVFSSYCNKCGTPYESWSYKSNYCNVCIQTLAIEKLAEDQERQRVRAEEDAHYREMEMQFARQVARARAAEQRELAEKKARLYEESLLSATDAYQFGRDYLKEYYKAGNPANMRVFIKEDHTFQTFYNNPYASNRLRNEFHKGHQQTVNELRFSVDRGTMISSAFSAGYEVTKGILGTSFCLHTGASIFGYDVYTEGVESNLKKTINEKTGEVSATWNHPFSSDDLNKSFEQGVLTAIAELNTDEQKTLRLNTEVVEIKKQRALVKHTKRTFFALSLVTLLFPFVAWFLVWDNTEGWTTFFGCLLVVPIFSIYLLRCKERYRENNYKLL